ncbi:MAG: TIGR02147 family protein [Chitinispirillaceae bacterium]|nr:TIGR02147 family protein [Chitinispirillaceae bacterium]
MKTLPNVIEYLDYRKYLHDYFEHKKGENSLFSFGVLARKAGFRNRGFMHSVMAGNKNLSKSSVFKISQALSHSKSESDYFENLVFFNQSKELVQRNHFFSAMTAVKSRIKGAVQIQNVRIDQYEYYSAWYHSAVRSAIDLYPFKNDYAWLSKKLYPPITVTQARSSVKLLVRLGLIQKRNDGYYELSAKHISTGAEILDLAALNFHRESARLAAAAIESLPKDIRNISGLTMGISRCGYERICNEVRDFRQRISEIVQSDTDGDRVYQMNIHVFPFSKPDTPEDSPV